MNLEAFAETVERHRVIGQVVRVSSGDSIADVSAAAHALSEILTSKSDRYAMLLEFRVYAYRNPEVQDRLAALRDSTNQVMTAFITEQVERYGVVLRLSPAETATVVMTFINGALLENFGQQGIVVSPELIGTIFNLMFDVPG